jgi:hypothetical protein
MKWFARFIYGKAYLTEQLKQWRIVNNMYITDKVSLEVHVGFPNSKHFVKGIHIEPEVPNEELENVLMKMFKLVTKDVIKLREEIQNG